MAIDNLFPDPVKIYRILKKTIPSLKNLNQDIMNRLCSKKMSSDFWWAMTGEFAIKAHYITLVSAKDPRFLIDINNSSEDLIDDKRISSALVSLVGRDVIIGAENNYKQGLVNDVSADTLLIEDEKVHFLESIKQIEGRLAHPFNKLTRVLHLLRLLRIKTFSLLKETTKLNLHIRKKNIDSLNFLKPVPGLEFENAFLAILPKNFLMNFPSWFVYLSEKIVGKNHKWVTYFGLELNLYQRILIAISYEKFGEKNIKIVGHGCIIGDLDFWYLYRFSLFPELKLQTLNVDLILPDSKNSKVTNGILFCPTALPWFVGFVSLKHFRALIQVYRKAVDLLAEGARNGKNIKIRYKDYKWLRGYVGQFSIAECDIPVESKNFEDSYKQYSTIVSIPYGTIAAKCVSSNISCLIYHQPISPTDKDTHLELCKTPGVYTNENQFLDQLKKIIENLPIKENY
jgi:hypothetical protein